MSYSSKADMAILQKAKMQIRALQNPLRQKMLAFIKQKRNRVCVSDIYKSLGIEQSVASQQLGWMRAAKIVTSKTEGKQRFYSVDEAAIKHIIATCAKM